ncbi:MAG TPA: hypothetical protein PLD59_13555 [Tepidisphaeraceae bacterium]|mgnify:CR=1 FL=1|nr:hypothetical protein [Tepidisphaeraceae bacterium]
MIARIAVCLGFAFVLSCSACVALAQAAATELVANPLFTAWANQKLGTIVVHSGSSKNIGLEVFIETVTTLESIAADEVTLRVEQTVTEAKKDPVKSRFTQTIASKVHPDQARLLANGVEVTVGGNTYLCAAYESVKVVGESGGATTVPSVPFGISHRQFMSDQVPGGIVKIEAHTDGPIAMKTIIDLVEIRPAK